MVVVVRVVLRRSPRRPVPVVGVVGEQRVNLRVGELGNRGRRQGERLATEYGVNGGAG